MLSNIDEIYRKYNNLYQNNEELDEVFNPDQSIPNNYFNEYKKLNLEDTEINAKSKIDFLREEIEKEINKEKEKYNLDILNEENIVTKGTDTTSETDSATEEQIPIIDSTTGTLTVSNTTPSSISKTASNAVSSTVVTKEPKTKKEIKKALHNAYIQNGVNPEMALILLSQDQLETGFEHTQGKFNYGNITVGSYRGGTWKEGDDYVKGIDHDKNNKRIANRFRSYKSIDDYVKDKLAFLRDLYDVTPNENIDSFLEKMTGNNRSKRKYAENTAYAEKVKRVYNGNKNYT